jgi:tRNA(adenine34) deaminase
MAKSYPLFSDEYFMQKALVLAEEAYHNEEIPVGAILVAEGNTIIGKGYNQTEQLTDVTAHAEILAITAGSNFLGAKYLKGCTLYVTLEPCLMCAGALAWAQLDRVVYGAADIKNGFSKVQGQVFHPKTKVVSGVLEKECEILLKSFFRKLRD